MKKSIKWKENIHWPGLTTGVVLLCFSLIFQTWDMAAVSIFALLGIVGLFFHNCWLDWKNAREIETYKIYLADKGQKKIERDLKDLDSLI